MPGTGRGLRGHDAREAVAVLRDRLLELVDGAAADAARPQPLDLVDAVPDPTEQALDMPLPLGRRGHAPIVPTPDEKRVRCV